MASRRATHAGSWYSTRRDQLAAQMSGWLEQANACTGAARAVIAPHAGFSYSGPTAAWAYKHVSPTGIRRVFVLGPSHHHYMLSRCAVSSCATYETPFGGIPVDRATSAALLETGAFDVMDLSVEEAEHSIEMHLPYILHVMGATSFELAHRTNRGAGAGHSGLLSPLWRPLIGAYTRRRS